MQAQEQYRQPDKQMAEKPDSRLAAGPSRRKAAFQGAGLLILGTICAIALIEIGFRLLPAGRHVDPSADRPRRYFVPRQTPQKPVFHLLPQKSPGSFRIITIGDSFTFGAEIQSDDAYPARLQRMLNLDMPRERQAEVVNAGVEGYSAAQELELLKRALQHGAPDLIIWQVTLNDPELQPYHVQYHNQDIHGRTHLTSPIFSYWKSLRFIIERILNTRTHRRYVDYYFELFDDRAKWQRFASSIEEAAGLSAAARIPFFVVVFPLFSHPFDERYPFQPLHDKITSLLGAKGIQFLDLRRTYQGMNPERLVVEPGQDRHPNEIAHRIAAEKIFSALARRNLIPPEFGNKRTSAAH